MLIPYSSIIKEIFQWSANKQKYVYQSQIIHNRFQAGIPLTKVCCLLLLLLSLKSWCSLLPYRFPARFPMIIFLLVLQEPELPAHDRAGERARQVLWHGRLGALQPHPQEISAYRLVYLYWAHLSTYKQINKLRNWIYQKPLISHHSKKYREYE